MGATPPSSLPAGTANLLQDVLNATVQYVDKHKSDRENPHVVTASQTGAYSKQETDDAINQRIVQIGSSDMQQAVYDPKGAGISVTLQPYTHTRSSAGVHNFVGNGSNGYARISAAYKSGDTFTVNGEKYTAVIGMTGEAVDTLATGALVIFTVDGENKRINFNGGGGVSMAKLAAATAETPDVLSGKKFFAKQKEILTGTMPNNGAWQTTINPGGSINIPKGYHNGSGRINANSVQSQLKSGTVSTSFAGNNWAQRNYLPCSGTVIGITAVRGTNDDYISGSINMNVPDGRGVRFSISGNQILCEADNEVRTGTIWIDYVYI